MEQFLLDHAGSVRSVAFSGALLGLAFWELARPRRNPSLSIGLRWPSNLGLAVLNGLLTQWLMPVLAVGAALIAQQYGWGILRIFPLPGPLALALAILALDLGDYAIHRVFHAIHLCWRLHRVHHADLDVDFTTSQRHHPIEVMVVLGLKLVIVISLGAPAAVVSIHEVVRLTIDVFNHANVKLPEPVDRWLRWVVVTPDMHRVHHSARQVETDSNYGNLLPWWDWCFGTYCAQPRDGHHAMTLGLEGFREPRDSYFHRILVLPFLNEGADARAGWLRAD